MALWKPCPDEPIGPKESLGRRLFGQPPLAGAVGQKIDPKVILNALDLRDFEDQRDGEVSLDRLGESGNPEKGVVAYLLPRAEADGNKRSPQKKFNGWAAIQARKLTDSSKFQLSIIPSPVAGDGMQENLYHSHIKALEGDSPYRIALHLREMFRKHGNIHFSPNNPGKPSWMRARLLNIAHWFIRQADKF